MLDVVLLLALVGAAAVALLAAVDARAGREWLDVVRGREAEHEPADDEGDDLAERHGAAGMEGTMGELKVAGGEARAKTLRLGERTSGVYRAVHAPESAAFCSQCPANDQHDSAPVQGARGARSEDRAYAALLRDSLRADGLAVIDAAAACDRQRSHVQDMCAPDGRGRAITLRDAVRIARVSRTWRAALVDLIGGVE